MRNINPISIPFSQTVYFLSHVIDLTNRKTKRKLIDRT